MVTVSSFANALLQFGSYKSGGIVKKSNNQPILPTTLLTENLAKAKRMQYRKLTNVSHFSQYLQFSTFSSEHSCLINHSFCPLSLIIRSSSLPLFTAALFPFLQQTTHSEFPLRSRRTISYNRVWEDRIQVLPVFRLPRNISDDLKHPLGQSGKFEFQHRRGVVDHACDTTREHLLDSYSEKTAEAIFKCSLDVNCRSRAMRDVGGALLHFLEKDEDGARRLLGNVWRRDLPAVL